MPNCAAVGPCNGGMASKGISARIGMTAISWVNSTEKADRPPGERIRFFSDNVCSTIAVDESDTAMPAVTATVTMLPLQTRISATATVVNATCAPPIPINLCRMFHSTAGSNSRPIKNSISTTPNSATCCKSVVSAPAKPKTGPIKIPAAK